MFKIVTDFFRSCDKKQFIIRWFFISVVLVVITSLISINVYEALELTQNIEFASYKYGKTDVTGVDIVEFRYKLGRWIMPLIHYIEINLLEKIGVKNPFIQAVVFRLTWGAIGLIAIYLLMLLSYKITDNEKISKIIIILLSILPFIPFFIVRGGNTTFSSVLLAIGISLFLLYSKNDNNQKISSLLIFFVGIVFGLAVVVRLQVLPFLAGFYLWVFFIFTKDKLDAFLKLLVMSLGIIISLIGGFFIDSWGYGEWTNTIWNYFDYNIIKGLSKVYGTDPFYGYFYLIPRMFPRFIIIPSIVMIGYVIFWIRNPKNILTWTTLPFVISHFFIAHKEARFMLPIFIFAPIILVMAFYFEKGRIYELYNKINKKIIKAIIFLFFLISMFSFFYIINKGDYRDTINFQRYIYYNFKDGFEGYTMISKESEYPFEFWVKSYFYRPKHFKTTLLNGIEQIEDIMKTQEKIYLIGKDINLTDKDNIYTVKELFSVKENNYIKQIIKLTINKIKKDKFDLSLPNKNICVLYLIERNHNTD